MDSWKKDNFEVKPDQDLKKVKKEIVNTHPSLKSPDCEFSELFPLFKNSPIKEKIALMEIVCENIIQNPSTEDKLR